MKSYKLAIALLILVVPWFQNEAMEQQFDIHSTGVKKINDELYAGKVEDGFYLGMERVDEKNIDEWLAYADEQLKWGSCPSNFDRGGIYGFQEMLLDYKMKHFSPCTEVWCAYTSKVPVTKKTKVIRDGSINMFVTVTTSPQALITSHMGISRAVKMAWDIIKGKCKKRPDESIHLHSFAAKVMNMRDSKKVYMFTSPLPVMRKILLEKLPLGSVFVGDDCYKKDIEAAKKDPNFWLSKHDYEFVQQWGGKLDDDKLCAIEKKYNLLKSCPPRIMRESQSNLTILDYDEKPLVKINQPSKVYSWVSHDLFHECGINQPYVLIDLYKLAKVKTLL